jgi:hypothetical protein
MQSWLTIGSLMARNAAGSCSMISFSAMRN